MRSERAEMSRRNFSIDSRFIFATLIACFVFCLVNGDAITSTSVDFAHHYALAHAIDVHGTADPRLRSLADISLQHYPNAVHTLIAWFTPEGASVLRTMTTAGWAFLIVGYALLVRLQLMILGTRVIAITVLLLQTAITIFLLASQHLYVMGAEVVTQYFLTQIFANVILLAIACVAAHYARSEAFWSRLLLYVFALFLFVEIHFAAFIMLGIFAGLDVLWNLISQHNDRENRTRVITETLIAYSVLFAVLLIVFFSPDAKYMRVIAAHDGTIASPYGSENAVAIVGFFTVAAAAALAVAFRVRFGRSAPLRSFVFFNVAVGAATIVTWLLLVTGFGGSPYAVKKFQFLLHSGLLAIVLVAIALALSRQRIMRKEIGLAPGIVAALFAAGLSFAQFEKTEDRSELVWIERAVEEWRAENAEPLEASNVFQSSRAGLVNYLFSIGILQVEARGAIDEILYLNDAASDLASLSMYALSVDRKFVAEHEECVEGRDGPVWTLRSACIDLISSDRLSAVLASGWHGVEQWGAWAAVSDPTIKFACAPEVGANVKLVFMLFHHSKPVTIRAGSTVVWSGEVAPSGVTAPIDIPPALCNRGAVELQFQTTEPVRPSDVVESNDSRPLGLGLIEFERR